MLYLEFGLGPVLSEAGPIGIRTRVAGIEPNPYRIGESLLSVLDWRRYKVNNCMDSLCKMIYSQLKDNLL